MARGRIPDDDLHESLSEGEGACSRICDGRSHLPLRGKLGWMTPRPGQKKTGKRNASLGPLFPSKGPSPNSHPKPSARSVRVPPAVAPESALLAARAPLRFP